MNKIIEYVIGAKDATGNAIKSALSRIKSFAASVGSNLQNIRAGFAMLSSAVQKAGQFMVKAFQFEKMTVQFKTLLGSMDAAREHMKMLQDLGDTPPFGLEEFAAASRALMVMTEGALGLRKSLELVGDAAAATGQPIQTLAHEVGRAYAIIRDGQPLTRATMALRNMGVLTPEVAKKLDDLQAAGASTTEIWKELEDALGRYKGAMAETEQTGQGLVDAIKSQWDDALREFGGACLETSKDGLGAVLKWMKRLREDGTIAVWADRAGQAFAKVAELARDAAKAINWLVEAYGAIRDFGERVGAGVGAFIGTAYEQGLGTGGSNEDAWQIVADAYESTRMEQRERKFEKKRREAKARREGVDRYAQGEADRVKKEQEEEEKKLKVLEEGQRKIDERRAEDAWKKYEEEFKKWQEAEKKQREANEKAIADARKKEWDAYARQVNRDYQDWQKESAKAEARLAAATQTEQQAWGWYRDKDAWAAQLQEERANAEAEKQFNTDFNNLKRFKSDWRTSDKLTDAEEIVRRVALAREEKSAAEEYVRITAEATQNIEAQLEEINNAIQEGE